MNRNETIVDMFKSGSVLHEIGDHYGISKERVRQILKSVGLTGKDGGMIVRAKQKKELKKE